MFHIAAAGLEYGPPDLGLGELAALTALWYLHRADSNTVILVEEAETFLSSQATVGFMDVLAETIDKRRLYAVVTTHSIEIAARAPLETIRLLADTPNGAEMRRPGTRAELEHLLNSYVGHTRIVLVEDSVAAFLMSELVARHSGLGGQAIEVIPADGASGVLCLCQTFPETKKLRLVGALDADQPEPPAGGRWPVFKLPGEEAPDAILRQAALDRVDLFASRLGRPPAVLTAALGPLAGRDVHDWFPDLAIALLADRGAVLRAAIDC